MTTQMIIPPFADILIAAKTAAENTTKALMNSGIFAVTKKMSALSGLDRRGLSDVGYDRIDFSTADGAAIHRALIKIHEW